MAKNRLTRSTALVGDLRVDTGGMVQKVLTGTFARADTVAKTLFTLPKGAIIIGSSLLVATASDAGTTATGSVGYQGGSGTELVNGQSLKTAGQYVPTSAQLTGTPLAAAKVVTAIYAETGTASTTGGPFVVVVAFVTV